MFRRAEQINVRLHAEPRIADELRRLRKPLQHDMRNPSMFECDSCLAVRRIYAFEAIPVVARVLRQTLEHPRRKLRSRYLSQRQRQMREIAELEQLLPLGVFEAGESVHVGTLRLQCLHQCRKEMGNARGQGSVADWI